MKNFTIIERHYFKDHLLRSYEFSFPFCIPNSTNTWEHIYSIPDIDEEMVLLNYKIRDKKWLIIHSKQNQIVFILLAINSLCTIKLSMIILYDIHSFLLFYFFCLFWLFSSTFFFYSGTSACTSSYGYATLF